MTDSIKKVVELRASVDRVWRALTDVAEFGAWFMVRLESPFACDQPTMGQLTYPGYEHLRWEVTTVAMEPQTLFAFTWHPYAVDPTQDYAAEPPTRVEFRLEPISEGTRLTITESGFDALPDARREEAMRMNSHGWSTQSKNIKAHVEA